jgi:hypothetical protein
MLVMAIEAAKQLADVGRIIIGFNIKDITFHSALIIPVRPEGIETQFYMRPAEVSNEKDASWFDFRLCTCDDNKWSKNCKGSIQVVYEHIETEIHLCRRALMEPAWFRVIYVGNLAKTVLRNVYRWRSAYSWSVRASRSK